MNARKSKNASPQSLIDALELDPRQSIELLKALHILTREGNLNQDSRRKLKQVRHLCQFVAEFFKEFDEHSPILLADHGAGKSYFGFILYDLYLKHRPKAAVFGIETRDELVKKSQELAQTLQFERMYFFNETVQNASQRVDFPEKFDIVTALHACDTATDDAIQFALKKRAKYIALVPCCQAEVAAQLRKYKQTALASPLAEIWRHPIHSREFGSHLTNVLRCLQLESHGYQVTVTEVGGVGTFDEK